MPSPNLDLPHVQDNPTQAPTTANTQIDGLDNATQRLFTHTVSGSFTITDDDFRTNFFHVMSGTPGGAFTADHLGINRHYAVKNDTADNCTVEVTGGGGNSVIISAGATQELYCDGTDVEPLGPAV